MFIVLSILVTDNNVSIEIITDYKGLMSIINTNAKNTSISGVIESQSSLYRSVDKLYLDQIKNIDLGFNIVSTTHKN